MERGVDRSRSELLVGLCVLAVLVTVAMPAQFKHKRNSPTPPTPAKARVPMVKQNEVISMR